MLMTSATSPPPCRFALFVWRTTGDGNDDDDDDDNDDDDKDDSC